MLIPFLELLICAALICRLWLSSGSRSSPTVQGHLCHLEWRGLSTHAGEKSGHHLEKNEMRRGLHQGDGRAAGPSNKSSASCYIYFLLCGRVTNFWARSYSVSVNGHWWDMCTSVGRQLVSLCVHRWANLEHPKRVNNSWTSSCHMHMIWYVGWEEMCQGSVLQCCHIANSSGVTIALGMCTPFPYFCWCCSPGPPTQAEPVQAQPAPLAVPELGTVPQPRCTATALFTSVLTSVCGWCLLSECFDPQMRSVGHVSECYLDTCNALARNISLGSIWVLKNEQSRLPGAEVPCRNVSTQHEGGISAGQ